ncbi:hypothetical protein G5714_010604 [Onychostoma macrolepis]|uniref:Uncharacterized protein n=1 Tax=Onychostoma macrolepis TaxID=369639 RepID=A0A7J6CMP2_9TELE|nr:hypothetical protein G5714_010604 [Onychostoma macrolepis]
MCPTVIGSWWRNIKRCSEPSDKIPRQLPDTSNRTRRETFCIHDHLREDFSLDYGLTLTITPNPKQHSPVCKGPPQWQTLPETHGSPMTQPGCKGPREDPSDPAARSML